MRKISGIYDFNSKQITSSSTDIFHFENNDCFIEIFGHTYIDDEDNPAEKIFSLYCEFKYDIVNKLNGNYLLVIYNKTTNDFIILQDRSSSSVIMYYTENDNKLYYSTSLESVLEVSEIDRKLNDDYVGDFLTNGYIVGENTLVNNVFKLKFLHCITVENSKTIQKKLIYDIEDLTIGEAAEKWCSVLDGAINKCVDGDYLSSALSSGYDSNYILYVVDRDNTKPIKCFSIGGKFGKNELPVVKENAKLYPKVELKYELTDSDTLNNLPDIVKRLEGSVFECGLFLQYELAELVSQNNVPYMICGECADQVMNPNYFVDSRSGDSYGEKNFYYDFAEYPSVYGHYVIQKKNGILFNSFDIESRYPFLDREFLPVAKALAGVNKKDKRFHVAVCESLLHKQIIDNISKIGGSTDVHSLFENKEEINYFINKIKSSELYQKYHETVNYCGFSNKIPNNKSIKQSIINGLKTVLGKKVKVDYFWEELELRELLCYTYIILFEKIFIMKEDLSLSENTGLFNIIK